MTDMTAQEGTAPPAKKGKLLPVLAAVLALGAGGAVGWLGIWSPLDLLAGKPAEPAVDLPKVTFLDLPRMVVSLPSQPPRTVALTAMIDIDPAKLAEAKILQPRLADSFTAFLSNIDPAAFDRRGILDIVRAELATRARFILGDDAVNDILITEYRLQ